MSYQFVEVLQQNCTECTLLFHSSHAAQEKIGDKLRRSEHSMNSWRHRQLIWLLSVADFEIVQGISKSDSI
jgi:hypothetical protein